MTTVRTFLGSVDAPAPCPGATGAGNATRGAAWVPGSLSATGSSCFDTIRSALADRPCARLLDRGSPALSGTIFFGVALSAVMTCGGGVRVLVRGGVVVGVRVGAGVGVVIGGAVGAPTRGLRGRRLGVIPARPMGRAARHVAGGKVRFAHRGGLPVLRRCRRRVVRFSLPLPRIASPEIGEGIALPEQTAKPVHPL